PKGGGRGFLWQMYAGDPWYTSEPFEDERTSTLGIIAVNHLAHATRDRHELADWYERVFGARTVWESPNEGSAQDGASDPGFRTRVVEAVGGQLRFEAI